jgi:hypothetical protein
MASTYSDLKIELIGTGEQSGTWGTTTNTNLSTALGEAITGSADVAFSSADVTVTLTDTNNAQTARNLRLNLTGTSGGARQLILGSGCQIEKLYLINNGLADAVTVKNTSGTGIAVPAGKSMFVYNNGTNVVDATTYLSSLTLGSALPVASGGTGVTSSTGSTAVVLSTSPTLVTPVLGVASATSINKVALTAPATGSTLTIADGKTLTASNSLNFSRYRFNYDDIPIIKCYSCRTRYSSIIHSNSNIYRFNISIRCSISRCSRSTTISATAATGTINYDATTQSVLYYTTDASANWTVNFRGNGTTSLNTFNVYRTSSYSSIFSNTRCNCIL